MLQRSSETWTVSRNNSRQILILEEKEERSNAISGNNGKRIGVHDPRNLVSVDPDEIPLLSGNPWTGISPDLERGYEGDILVTLKGSSAWKKIDGEGWKLQARLHPTWAFLRFRLGGGTGGGPDKFSPFGGNGGRVFVAIPWLTILLRTWLFLFGCLWFMSSQASQ